MGGTEEPFMQHSCQPRWHSGWVAILDSPVGHTDLDLGTVQQLLPHSFHHQVYKLPLEAPSGKGRWCRDEESHSPEITSSKKPPLTTLSEAAPRGLLSWTRCRMGWACPLASPLLSTILHQALGSRRLTCMSLIFVGTGTRVQMEAHTGRGILEPPK